nr:uncharacterized protein LOC118051203 [Populus alba]
MATQASSSSRSIHHGHPSILKQLQHPPWPAMPSSRFPTVETSSPSNQVISQRIRKPITLINILILNATMATQASSSSRSIHHGHPSMLKQLQHPPWPAMPSSRFPTVETSCCQLLSFLFFIMFL